MLKFFISQSMKGKSNEEIENSRKIITERICSLFPNEEIVIIDSFFKNAPHDAKPLWFLGKSLELLSTADYAVFGNGWKNARGCRIEHECALEYGIGILYD